jgi:hypothetical protein
MPVLSLPKDRSVTHYFYPARRLGRREAAGVIKDLNDADRNR